MKRNFDAEIKAKNEQISEQDKKIKVQETEILEFHKL